MTSSRDTVLAGLSTLLWRERQLLELLLFKLVEEQLVLRTVDDRWVQRAGREVEVVLEALKRAELRREVEVAALAADLGDVGAADDGTLRALIGHVGEPWDEILAGHRAAFLGLAAEVGEAGASRRAAASVGESAARAAVTWRECRSVGRPSLRLVGDDGTTSAAATRTTARPGPAALGKGARSALRASAAILPPTLVGFLS